MFVCNKKNTIFIENYIKQAKMRTKEDQRQFILDTLLVYKNDKRKCALDDSGCVYLTKDGRKCAVGQHLKPGEWQKFEGEYIDLVATYSKQKVLTDEALSMGFDNKVWRCMQEYHDALTYDSAFINKQIEEIEKLLDIELSELKF